MRFSICCCGHSTGLTSPSLLGEALHFSGHFLPPQLLSICWLCNHPRMPYAVLDRDSSRVSPGNCQASSMPTLCPGDLARRHVSARVTAVEAERHIGTETFHNEGEKEAAGFGAHMRPHKSPSTAHPCPFTERSGKKRCEDRTTGAIPFS